MLVSEQIALAAIFYFGQFLFSSVQSTKMCWNVLKKEKKIKNPQESSTGTCSTGTFFFDSCDSYDQTCFVYVT